MDLLVVGAGDVGRWVGQVIDADVTYTDVDPEMAAAAVTATPDANRIPIDAGDRFEVVCIAVPLPAAADAIAEHAPKASRAVVDVTGAMVEPLSAMADAVPDLERASFHPLFAPDAAPGRIALSKGAGGPTIDELRAAFTTAGNEIVEVSPSTHDEAMRTIQGRAHAAILAFAMASDEVPPELATPVYEELADLVERVTGGTPRVYADIQRTFGGAADIASAAEQLAAADTDGFVDIYEGLVADER